MNRKFNGKTAIIATVVGAASLTGAGFGLAHAMTPAASQGPSSVSVDHSDKPGAVDTPEAGDTPDKPGTDTPEAGDTPDGPGQN